MKLEDSGPQRALRIAALLTAGLIVFFTLGPIEAREQIVLSLGLERPAAFALLGLLSGLLAPRRPLRVFLLVLIGCALLEAMQTLTHSRHGRIEDFWLKAIGAALGVLLAHILFRWMSRRAPPHEGARAATSRE
ncbi:hypothetical protein GCM10007301_12360 [Azorhizobium oxalatiphilum]|uniref:VanZ-like domain-containing protein n=1 Tax=Azorhizobium oxalatiphilum TaxID=980631 RepID=A0A917BPW1_9HYPH|nr:VanZ family protein [Azorhizobium oxalatiphilum]GGF54375.1 hypothetical protein GCM10007301_12360 [Azorhizobium oxalatiphilum]